MWNPRRSSAGWRDVILPLQWSLTIATTVIPSKKMTFLIIWEAIFIPTSLNPLHNKIQMKVKKNPVTRSPTKIHEGVASDASVDDW